MKNSARTNNPSDRRLFPRVELITLLFTGLVTLISLMAPEDLYAQSALVRTFADVVRGVIGSIDDFASVSMFPGVTRVVLACAWAGVLPLALYIAKVPGILVWDDQVLRRIGRIRWAIVAFILLFAVVLPAVMTVDEGVLTSELISDRIIRFASTSRFGLGLVAGLYCATAALFLSLLPTFLKHRNFT